MEKEKLLILAEKYDNSIYIVGKLESYFFDEDGETLKEYIKDKEIHVYFLKDGGITEIEDFTCVELLEYLDCFGYTYKFNKKFKYYKEFNSLYENDFNSLI